MSLYVRERRSVCVRERDSACERVCVRKGESTMYVPLAEKGERACAFACADIS